MKILTKTFMIRMTPQEHAAIKADARKNGMSAALLMRTIVNNHFIRNQSYGLDKNTAPRRRKAGAK
jgi:hypothetical protein